MPITHVLLALLVVVIWGINFISVTLALNEISPLWLCALRFLLAGLPGLLFFKPPAMPFHLLLLYGLVTFALQFAFMFLGMNAGMTPGLASLLVQVQVFFSMFFAAILLKEKPDLWQIGGALISFSGIALIARHLENGVTLSGFLLILAAAASWGLGNMVTKKTGKVNTMSLVVWGSAAAFIPMTLMACIFEGFGGLLQSFHHMSLTGCFSILYIVFASTWVGYGLWNWLISRHPVSSVVPFALLIPLVGVLSSVIILKESFYMWKAMAGLLIIAGLIINLIGSRFFVSPPLLKKVSQ